jgi:hypothetical protein
MSEQAEEPKEELYRFILGQLRRVVLNIQRVSFLVGFAERRLTDGNATRSLHTEDILRAAVVLLHATLEDFLRYIGALYLPEGNEETLNRISLAGTHERPEKFFLGRLAQHRGKTVDALIVESVTCCWLPRDLRSRNIKRDVL